MSVAQATEQQAKQPEVEAAAAASAHEEQGNASQNLLSGDEVHALSQKAEGKDAKQKRTPGLKFVDGAVYAGVTHFGVFAISVVFTFLTRHGDKIGGKIPLAMQKRADVAINFMTKKMNMGEQKAKDLTVVGISFIDGCLLLPLVRFLESKRTNIAYAVDKMLGKVPKTTGPDGKLVDDKSIYAAEPHQTWTSVIAGRVAAAGMVVPIALALDKWVPSKDKVKEDGTSKNFNDLVMRDFGAKIADKIEDKSLGKGIVNTANNYFARRHEKLPEGQDKYGRPYQPKKPYKLNLHEFMEVNVFETVWTAICTAVLFVTSRGVAKVMGNRKEQKAQVAQTAQQGAPNAEPAERAQHPQKKEEKAHHASKQHDEAVVAHSQQKPKESTKQVELTEKEINQRWVDLERKNPELAKELIKQAEQAGNKADKVARQREEASLTMARA